MAGWGGAWLVHALSAPCILAYCLGARAGAGAITFFYRILAQAAAPQKLEPGPAWPISAIFCRHSVSS